MYFKGEITIVNVYNKIKKIIVFNIFLILALQKNSFNNNLKVKAQTLNLQNNLEKIKTEKTTTKKFILNLIRNGKNDAEIINSYFEMPPQEISEIIMNDKINLDGGKISNLTKDKNEQTRINNLENLLNNEEKNYIKKLTPLPTDKNNLSVMIIPGHGFEDDGATFNNGTIKEKFLNQLISYELAISLLEKGYEVYMPYDLEEHGLVLPYENPKLHIIFKKCRPPITGYKNKNGTYNRRMAEATTRIMLTVAEKLKENNPNARFVSICLHHNFADNKNIRGFIPYFRQDASADYIQKSKKLGEILLNNCRNIYQSPSIDASKVAGNIFLVTQPGPEVALLVELGFGSNDAELQHALNASKRKEMAAALEKSITEYFKST